VIPLVTAHHRLEDKRQSMNHVESLEICFSIRKIFDFVTNVKGQIGMRMCGPNLQNNSYLI
jgi:hypothetical protein